MTRNVITVEMGNKSSCNTVWVYIASPFASVDRDVAKLVCENHRKILQCEHGLPSSCHLFYHAVYHTFTAYTYLVGLVHEYFFTTSASVSEGLYYLSQILITSIGSRQSIYKLCQLFTLALQILIQIGFQVHPTSRAGLRNLDCNPD